MNTFQAVILGIIEGLTEFLPISSTAHLFLSGKLMGLNMEPDGFFASFGIAIQPGAILAVVALYGRKFLVKVEVLKRVAVAFVPTAVLGALLYSHIKQLLDSPPTMLSALLLGGMLLIVFERFRKSEDTNEADLQAMTYAQAFLIGCLQTLSFIPGVSRAAATILGGMLLGLRRTTAVEFSFLLAVPTMLAATAKDIKEQGATFSTEQWLLLLVGFVTSFVVALLTIQFLLRYIRRHDFTAFGIYRIVFALVVAGILYL